MLGSTHFLNLCLVATLGLVSIQSYAETDAELMASGQWRDPATGLIWMRCSIGQTWTGSTCSGTPIKLNWQDANDYSQLFNEDGFAGRKNWRLPKVEELVTIRRCSNGWFHEIKSIGNLIRMGIKKRTLPNGRSVPLLCAEGSRRPTLDTRTFPNTPEEWYWSASPYANDYGVAWLVFFYDGHPGYAYKGYNHHVRAVRGSQSVSEASSPVEAAATSARPVAQLPIDPRQQTPAATSARPVASEVYSPRPLATDSQADQSLLTSGQWRDPDTGLIWMRCLIGQTWTGSTCSGTPIELSWRDANDYFQQFNQQGFAGHQNWRLPKIEELVTLRRCSNGWAQKGVTLPNGRSVPKRCADGSRRPTIDIRTFPNTPTALYWSASPYTGYDNIAWFVGLNYGSANYHYKNNSFHVRAVRAGQ